jgi:hydrogenase expression/formation protein HypC
MCLVLPSRIVAVLDREVEVELADGQHAVVNAELRPDLAVGDYVLVDRGLVIERIDAEEALAILAMYAEIGELLDAQDAMVLAAANTP